MSISCNIDRYNANFRVLYKGLLCILASEKELSPPGRPLSAAQVIMRKHNSTDVSRGVVSAGTQASSIGRTLYGNSLGGMSHGNSLASLTGWGSVDQEDGGVTQSKPQEIQKGNDGSSF